jgi:hypothetical protein
VPGVESPPAGSAEPLNGIGREDGDFAYPCDGRPKNESKVLLIDAHPQHTATDWSAVREKPPPFMLIGLPQPVLHRVCRRSLPITIT